MMEENVYDANGKEANGYGMQEEKIAIAKRFTARVSICYRVHPPRVVLS